MCIYETTTASVTQVNNEVTYIRCLFVSCGADELNVFNSAFVYRNISIAPCWRSLPRQLANRLHAKRSRGPRGAWPGQIWESTTPTMAMAGMGWWLQTMGGNKSTRLPPPTIFKLVRRKNRTVRQELLNGNWISRSLLGQITKCVAAGWCARLNHLEGRLMVFTPLARHIEYNSMAHIEHFSMISSGRHMRKINARYTPGSSCTVKL